MITVSVFTALASIAYLRPNSLRAFKTDSDMFFRFWSQPDPLYYAKNLKNFVGPYILVLSLPLLLSYLLNFKKREKLFFYWFIVPVVFFSLSCNKNPRYFLPLLPAFSLILAPEILNNDLAATTRRIFCFVFIFAAILQYTLYNCGFLDKDSRWPYEGLMNKGIISIKKDPYWDDASKLLDILIREKASMTKDSQRINVLFLFPKPQFSFFISMYGFIVNSPLEGARFPPLDAKEPFDCGKEISRADFIIMDGTPAYPVARHNREKASCLRAAFAGQEDKFMTIADMPAFGSHVIYVYKKSSNKAKD